MSVGVIVSVGREGVIVLSLRLLGERMSLRLLGERVSLCLLGERVSCHCSVSVYNN